MLVQLTWCLMILRQASLKAFFITGRKEEAYICNCDVYLILYLGGFAAL